MSPTFVKVKVQGRGVAGSTDSVTWTASSGIVWRVHTHTLVNVRQKSDLKDQRTSARSKRGYPHYFVKIHVFICKEGHWSEDEHGGMVYFGKFYKETVKNGFSDAQAFYNNYQSGWIASEGSNIYFKVFSVRLCALRWHKLAQSYVLVLHFEIGFCTTPKDKKIVQ